MEKKLLITVSSEVSHLYGIRFAGSFFRNKSTLSATLLYITPHTNPTGAGLNPAGRKAARDRQEESQQYTDVARRKLCDYGFLAENVSTKLAFKQFGTVTDIVREARVGH